MKFLSATGLESQPFKLKKGHRTLLFTLGELEQLKDEIESETYYIAWIIRDGGKQCGNCGCWRRLNGRELEKCSNCRDEAIDIYEASEATIP